MAKDSTSFLHFGKEFQEKLVFLIFKDRQFSDQIREVLKVEYFENESLRIIVDKIFKYKDKYKLHPNKNVLESILSTELGDVKKETKDEVEEVFNRLGTLKTIEEKEYIKDKSLDFCKKQVLKQAMIKSIDLLEKSSFNEISNVINGALKLGLDTDVGYEYIEDFEERYSINKRSPISTGWDDIDNITQGGLGAGELGVIMAASGTGKSYVLVHFGAMALKEGKNVLHYTLELSDKQVANRYDACLTKFSLNELIDNKDKIFKCINDIPGKLIIKEYPTKSASVRTIRMHLEKLAQKNFIPDIILIDYADLLKPVSSSSEKRHELESIYEDLRAISQEFKVPLYTATQGNRSAWNNELVDGNQIAESFSKLFVADFVISLSRTKEDKLANRGRLFIIKNRFGNDGRVFEIFFDPATAQIRILSEKESSEMSVKQAIPEKAAYKEFIKNKKL